MIRRILMAVHAAVCGLVAAAHLVGWYRLPLAFALAGLYWLARWRSGTESC